MVKIALKLKATLENIEELKSTDPNFRWYLKFTCSECKESSDKWNDLSLSEVISSFHGFPYHFQCKCKCCKRTNTVSIIEDSLKTYTASDDEKFKNIVVFDCRGLEPTEFLPGDGWVIKTVDHGTEFKNVDLTEGSWADYCDIINQPVSVDFIEHSFEVVK